MQQQSILKRILVVDDEVENLKSLRRELQSWLAQRHVGVDLCGSAEDALDMMSRTEYAVLLTDNRMPGMNGTDLVKRVGHEYPRTVSIMLTGYTEKHDIEGALSSGIFAFLIKPWDREALRGEIEKAIQVHYTRARRLENSRRMNQELQLAVEFQNRLLRISEPEMKGDVTASYVQHPAGKVGVIGDYLDIKRLDDATYLLLIGDVSGHGLRTTFVSAMLKAVLTPEYLARSQGNQFSPGEFLAWLNHRVLEFTEHLPDLFVAFSASVVDTKRRTVTTASAGNPLPLLQKGNLIQPVEIYGVALGVNGDAVYEETRISLQPGELLYFFTDGVNLPRKGKNLADRDTLFQAILQSRPEEPVARIITRLRNAGGEEELGDDITMVRLYSHRLATPGEVNR
jgi:sigma-B regulation protein RsbU (phosphoserine phosphatase)